MKYTIKIECIDQSDIDAIKQFAATRLAKRRKELNGSNNIDNVATEVIKWFKRKNLTEITQRYLQQYGPSCYKNATHEYRTTVLEELVSCGLIKVVVNQKTKKTIIRLITDN